MSRSALDERLEILRQEFARRLPDRIAFAREAVDTLQLDPGADEPLRYAYRQFHSLAGSAGTYGYDEISQFARVGEALLDASFEEGIPLQARDFDRLHELLADLQNVASPTKL